MKHFLTLIFSFFLLATQAQSLTVSGKVIDKNSKAPVGYCSVAVKEAGKPVGGALTEENGTFTIPKLSAKTYEIEVQFIGYKPYSAKIDLTNGKSLTLPNIAIEEEATMLKEVNVVAERSTIEQKIDRKVINVGRDLTTAGATASDIMNNIPSVNVDQDGKLSLRGNENVRVLVDGRPSNLSADQLLKQIPSTSIKKIELITNPSAKYNPEGMSGIINIVLYKNANDGFNGNTNLGLTVGNTPKFNSSTSMNYRRGSVNVFATYGNNFAQNLNNGKVIRTDGGPGNTVKVVNDNNSNNIKFGADFYLNDHNTISIYTNQNFFNGSTLVDTRTTSSVPAEDSFQPSRYDNGNRDGSYNIAYKKTFDQEGRTLDVEVNHSRSRFETDGSYFTDYTAPEIPDFVYTDKADNRPEQTTANVDYVHPFGEKSKLELGVEGRFWRNHNQYFTDNAELEEADFRYDLNIYSAYATFGQNFGKFGYQAGLRFESYKVVADNYTERVYEDDYLTLYPSLSLTYNLKEKNMLQLSYSRRVDRPSLQQVAPIREFSTPLFTSRGNPELNPQFTNSVELNYVKTLTAGTISGGVFVRITNDQINRVIFPDPNFPDTNRMVMTFENFDTNTSYGFELSANYRITKKWDVQPAIDFSSIKQQGTVSATNADGVPEFQNIEVTTSAFNARLNTNYRPNKNWSFLLFGFYRGPVQGLQSKTIPMYKVDFGCRYALLDNRLSISLRSNDLFNWQKFGFDSRYPYPAKGEFKWESRTVYLGLNYMFGGGKNRELQRKQRDNNTLQGGGGMF